MTKPTHYYVDFSDLFIEAADRDEALDIVQALMIKDSRYPEVCNVDECRR